MTTSWLAARWRLVPVSTLFTAAFIGAGRLTLGTAIATIMVGLGLALGLAADHKTG